jgi:nitrite reductase/ring-hydroxylating ferredoxin subunit
VEGQGIIIVRAGPGFAAFAGRCPHAAGPMHRGWVEDDEIVCPLHYWRFRLADGACNSVDGERLASFPCEVVDGLIRVML